MDDISKQMEDANKKLTFIEDKPEQTPSETPVPVEEVFVQTEEDVGGEPRPM